MDTTRESHIVVKEKDKELEAKWYAVYTRPRFEKQVHRGLHDQGIDAYLPLVKTMKQWSDRKKMVEIPLTNCAWEFARVSCSFLTIRGMMAGMAGSKKALQTDMSTWAVSRRLNDSASTEYKKQSAATTSPLAASAPTMIHFRL